MLRWSVAAQAAAVEREGWLPALRRSATLTAGHYPHVFVLGLCVVVITLLPGFLVNLGFGNDSTDPASFLVGLLLDTFTWSFTALTAALLYFDLRSRRRLALIDATGSAPEIAPAAPSDAVSQVRHDPAIHSWDPSAYSDQDRPLGWYVDPRLPDRMRYWGEGDPPDWGKSIRTPRKVRREIREGP
jgi:hypothetical protein